MTPTDERPSLFERLKAGLQEGVQFAQGKRKLRTTVIPDLPPALHPQDVLQLRQRLHMSQPEFARLMNVSVKTVQTWEQGTRSPSQAAGRLLQVLRAQPEMVCAVVGIPGPAEAAGVPVRRARSRRHPAGAARSPSEGR
jgi:putative transcriptional regulator